MLRYVNVSRFSYWALNMIQRKRALQQSSVFIKQNPGESHFTIEQLREMVSDNSSTAFMAKLSRYVSNITGSNAYWNKVRDGLKSIITAKGVPTIFFTFLQLTCIGQSCIHFSQVNHMITLMMKGDRM